MVFPGVNIVSIYPSITQLLGSKNNHERHKNIHSDSIASLIKKMKRHKKNSKTKYTARTIVRENK